MNNLLDQFRLEPALTWKLAVNILGHDPDSTEARQAANVTRHSSLVTKLLSERDASGHIPFHPYKKWNGAHWTLSIHADLGYPAGDESLRPIIEQSFNWLLGEAHKKHIRMMDGRVRRCASQEGNAVYYSLSLGLADGRTQELAERLMKWQWPDGGYPAESVYYHTRPANPSGYSPVSYGGTSKERLNPFVTADALYVLRLAGRM